MSKIERFKKKDDLFDTLEMEVDKDTNTGEDIVKNVTILDNKTGNKRIKFYVDEDNFIYKIEAFAKGHDIDSGYEGPTAIYEYRDGLIDITCNFKYLRSETKLVMEGIIKFNRRQEQDTARLIKSIHYLEDGVNIANRIDYVEDTNKYMLIERELVDGVSKLVFQGEFTAAMIPTGIWTVHAKSLDDNRDISIEIDTVTQDLRNNVLM